MYVPLKRRAAKFLEALRESGNVSMACEIAGIGKDRIYRHRRDNEEFAAAWEAAKAEFRERAEEEDGIDLDALERDGLAVRRGRGGQVQIVSAHPKAWTKRDEELFFAHYAETGNVAASARAAGFSAKAAWERARAVPSFRERLAEAKAEATDRLGFYLVEEGTNLLKGEDGARRDPQLAMWLLKREDQRKAGTLRRGGRHKGPPERSYDEACESILTKLEAIDRHESRQRLAQGWTKTEDGHWIPPGYGRIR
jgi:molybdenum-dependent DNA-binding transcriptional regulator ModE